MGNYYSPINGNGEVWDEKPEGYMTFEEYLAKYPIKYFALIGDNKTESVWWKGAYNPSNPDMIEMVSQAVGDYHIAQADGTWACDLEKYRAEKLEEIKGKSNARMQQVKGNYSSGEKDTFQQQMDGATDILNGNATTVNAIFVQGILAGRLGHTASPAELQAFCELIQNNYMTAASATGRILGYQQNLEAKARVAQTEAELDAIVWEDYKISEGAEA